jgi:hypothetical protein
MKARASWSSAFLLVFLGCGSGTIGGNGGSDQNNPGSGSSSSSGSGSNAGSGTSSRSGAGGSIGCSTCTTVDGGIVTADGGVVPLTPPTGGVVNQPITKLTAVEYANTVNDLFGTAIGASTSLVPPAAQTVPLSADSTAGGFAVGGASTDDTAQAYHDSAIQIATLVTSATNLPALLKVANCSAPSADSGSGGASCATAFVNAFAPLAFRHGTVDSATLMGLNGVYTAVAVTNSLGFTSGLAAVLEEILQSPYFLYHLETEQQALGMYNTAIPVTGYSMANRLSYLLWSSMPDSTLLAAAAANQLSTADQVSTQANRMIQDPRAHVGLQNFYQQWLTALSLPSGKVGNSTQITGPLMLSSTVTTKGESFASVFTTTLQQAIVDSFDHQVEDALWSGSNILKTLLTSDQQYVNAELAPIMGISGITGTGLQKVTVDATKRIGIISHPLVMATYATTSTSHPIKRGRWVWDQIVCQPLPNPPAGVPAFVPPQPGMSLRQDYELLTATGPYAGMASANPSIPCPQCHTRIDPIGFLLEPFDTVGQYRTIDDYGAAVDMTNITVAGFTAPYTGLNVTMNSAVQFAQALAATDLPSQCFTQNFYRYMARRNDAAADFPVENWLDQIFDASGQNLMPVLVGLTQTDAFLQRMNVQ